MIGGSDNLMVAYSPEARSDLPSFKPLDPKIAGGLGTRASVLVDLVYVCGGGNDTKVFGSCWTASVSGGEWTQVGNMKSPRSYHTLNTLNDRRLMATGGIGKYENGNPNLLNSVEFFTKENGWELSGFRWPQPDAKHCVLNLDKKIVLYISGIGSQSQTEVAKINIETGTKDTLQPPSSSKGGAHYCARNGNSVFMSEQQETGRENKVWELSLADNDSWTQLASVYDAEPQGLDIIAGELYFFGIDGVQVLKNGGWHRAKPQPSVKLGEGPALLVL